MERNGNKLIRMCGIAVCLALLFPFGGCGSLRPLKAFVTTLTAEEHIAAITKRTEEKYAKEISDGAITVFQVYTLWSFFDKPEYFLIEFDGNLCTTYDEEKKEEVYTGYAYFMGYVTDGDKYAAYHGYPVGIKSPFRKQGFESEKKYKGYAETLGVLKYENIMSITDTEFQKPRDMFNRYIHYEQGAVIPKSDYKILARYDYRMGCGFY